MNKNVIVLSIFAIVLGVVLVFAVNNSDHAENRAVKSLITHIRAEVNDSKIWSSAALYSYPTTCREGKENIYGVDNNLWSNFVSANKYSNGPIRLTSIEGGVMNVISWDDNVQVYDTKEMSFKFSGSEKNLIKLSRVGFNRDKTKALFCLSGNSADFYLLRKKAGEWMFHKYFRGWTS